MGSCSSKNVDVSNATTEKILELVRSLISDGEIDRANKIMKLNNIPKTTRDKILRENI